jgi:hypothetical protein
MGGGMHRTAIRARVNWRQLTACILACALIFQGIAFTLAGARVAADAATASDLAAFELCRHDGGATPGAPEAPAADSHCIFCLAGATYVLGTPAAAAQFHIVSFALAPWSFETWRLPVATVDASARPRGPPLAA